MEEKGHVASDTNNKAKKNVDIEKAFEEPEEKFKLEPEEDLFVNECTKGILM